MQASEISKRLNTVLLQQSVRSELLQRHFMMYGHSTLYGSSNPIFSVQRNQLRFNLIQSCCDTLVNKISKNKPRPTFLTDNGDWSNRKKAEKRENFVFGQFHKSKTYEKSPFMLLQAFVYGDGFMKVYNEEKEIKVENVLTLEMVFDDWDSLYGKPTQCWQLKYCSKDSLIDAYPDKADQIKNMATVMNPFYIGGFNANLVLVIEYWKLPSKKIGKNKWEGGEHHIVCGDLSLYEGSWDVPFFPFVHMGYVKNLLGLYHKGVTEVITPHQLEVNQTLKRISDSLRLIASPKVLYDYNSKIVQAHFNNDVGAMIGYLGQPPQFIMPQAVGSELFNHLQYVVQSAYAEVGISALTATSQKPAGLNSGKALREYNDIETERFSATAQAYEQAFIDLSELVLWKAKEVQEKYGRYSVLAPNKNGSEVINFKDIDMDQDAYVIQVYPSSMLPKTPAGRLEYVQEMLGAGLISPEEGLQLLDFPDTKKITKLKTSALDDILATIDYMLDNDTYLPPEPFQNLQMGIDYMNKAYLHYKNEKCPEEKLDLLIRWINDAISMLQGQQEQSMPNSSEITAPEEEMAVDEMAQDPTQAIIEDQLMQEEQALQEQTI